MPRNQARRVVAAAPSPLTGTGKSNCRAPAKMVDAEDRNLIRAGVPETVAMKVTGHLTPSVFRRYAIVDEGMLKEAGAKLSALHKLER